MKALSLGAGVLLVLSGCSSDKGSDGTDTNGPGAAGGAAFPGFAGSGNPGAGGAFVPGAGGSGVPGAGGSAFPGAGGTPGAGGAIFPVAGGAIVPGAGGSASPGAGGVVNPGAGGSVNPGNGGSAGGTVTLVHCDQTKETSAAPITQPCGDITAPTGTNVKLGPYGASMDVNVGKGFENPNPNDDATCPAFTGLFTGETLSTQLLDTGPQPCTISTPNTGNCLNYTLYSVYRPANWPAGPIPVLSWGNGTCAQPEGYGTLLRYIASYGFFVVAANSREVGAGTQLTKALDFAAAANQDPTSPYFGHLDMTKVGVMGHSQGAAGASVAGSDSRVQAVILFNAITASTTTPKPFLTVSGDMDVSGASAQTLATTVNGQPKAAYLYYHNPAGAAADPLKGHLVLMLSPDRVAPAATGWWQMLLENDATARNLFVGTSCGLCNGGTDYAYGEHGL